MNNLRMLARSRFYVADGMPIPRGWGVAFYSYAWRVALVLPVPLNLAVGLIVAGWRRAKGGLDRTWFDEQMKIAFDDGVAVGERRMRDRLEEAVVARFKVLR